ncbi:uncharacterized protein CLUP02_11065 [Colletotrichum lupini]|uniref:Uncharacterized protein n=1 Tax=Colletotrichum lupini TaxID=145971 RepID=A0A9Q8WJG6_9PEZI|nr:uncharacterized protein CLUP02_11065 [Colletotrichum lupini]UQC85566.1 hypothetical protein CLUP02_11065 [Colletotrichum lupini]
MATEPQIQTKMYPGFGPCETSAGPVICGVTEGPHKAEADDGPTKCRERLSWPESCLGRVSATILSLRRISIPSSMESQASRWSAQQWSIKLTSTGKLGTEAHIAGLGQHHIPNRTRGRDPLTARSSRQASISQTRTIAGHALGPTLATPVQRNDATRSKRNSPEINHQCPTGHPELRQERLVSFAGWETAHEACRVAEAMVGRERGTPYNIGCDCDVTLTLFATSGQTCRKALAALEPVEPQRSPHTSQANSKGGLLKYGRECFHQSMKSRCLDSILPRIPKPRYASAYTNTIPNRQPETQQLSKEIKKLDKGAITALPAVQGKDHNHILSELGRERKQSQHGLPTACHEAQTPRRSLGSIVSWQGLCACTAAVLQQRSRDLCSYTFFLVR